MPLTDTAIRNAKPDGKTARLYDANGLYLELSPAGGRWWRLKYRHGGKEKRISLGTYPDVSLKQAREARDAARKLVAQGIDPSAERRGAKEQAQADAAGTFSALAEAWFTAEIAHKSESYRSSVRRILDRDVLPYIGQRPARDITSRELIPVLDRIKARGAEETSRRARESCGQVFRYAIRRGLADNDPTYALRGDRRQSPVKHFSAITDPAGVARLMLAIDAYGGSPEVRAALRISALTFQRPGEIRAMLWADLDLDGEHPQWRYIASKTKTPHIVPLAAQAVDVLRELHPLTGRSAYVFPSVRSPGRPLSENTIRVALRTMGFTNDEMTAHGFRAMARSLLAEQGWKPDVIERQLAHKAAGPLGAAYDRAAYLDDRRRMMKAWADYLDGLRAGGNVVAINRKSGGM